MTLAVPFNDFPRRQVLYRLPMADGPAVLDMKQSSSSLVTPLQPNDLDLHFKTSREDEEYLLTMWANQSHRDAALNADTNCWSDWQNEGSLDSLLAQSSPSELSQSTYHGSLLDSNATFFDAMQLPTPPSELDLAMNQRDCQVPDLFSPVSPMDVYSMNGMWQDFPSDFHTTSESLPELPISQPLSYIPASPASDVSASSYNSLPPMSRQSSSYYPAASYPPTPSSSSSYSPQMKEEQPKPSLSRSTSQASAAKSTSPTREEGNALRPHPCLYPDCGRWFTRSYTRNVHMLTHRRSNDPKPFGCTVAGCSEGFSRKHDRLRHEVRQHGRGSNWRCPLCATSRFYSSQTTLERHLSEKHHKDG